VTEEELGVKVLGVAEQAEEISKLQ